MFKLNLDKYKALKEHGKYQVLIDSKYVILIVSYLCYISLYKLLTGKMASVEVSKLSKADHDELCCSYAALMLHDDGLEISVSRIKRANSA